MNIRLFFFLVLITEPVFATCRTYHFDHDGNPHTPVRVHMACETRLDLLRIPKYVTHKVPQIEPQSSPQAVRHISLPRPRPPKKCRAKNFYQIVKFQTIAQCLTN